MKKNTLLILIGLIFSWTYASSAITHKSATLGSGRLNTLNLNDYSTITASVWVKSGDNSSWASVFANDNGGYDIALNTYNDEWTLFHNNNQKTGIMAKIGEWQHLTAVFSPTSTKLYINGQLVYTGAGSTTRTGYSYTKVGSGTGAFNGEIDDLRFWNYERTQAEIQASMNSTLVGNESGLIAYYTFDNSDFNDVTSNNHDASSLTGVTYNDSYAMAAPTLKPISNLSETSFTINWETPIGFDPNEYLVSVDNNADFSSPIIDNASTGTNLSMLVENLDSLSTFYYKVTAVFTGISRSSTGSIKTLGIPLVLDSLKQTSGHAGDTIEIVGSGFNIIAQNNIVYFENIRATIVSSTSSLLKVIVPFGAHSVSTVTIVNKGSKEQLSTLNTPTPFFTLTFDGKTIMNNNYSIKTYNLGGGSSEAIIGGDLNSDGFNDVVVLASYSGQDSILVYNGSSSGLYRAYGIAAGGGNGWGTIDINDLDNDGDLDILAATSHSSNDLFAIRNNGNGTFELTGTFSVGYIRNLTPGDFNNDGYIDYTSGSSWYTDIIMNNGDFTFTYSKLSNTASQCTSVGDFNEDGNLDILASQSSPASVKLYLGNGDGTFGTTSNINIGSTAPSKIEVADFNKDGHLDIVASYSNTIAVTLGDGTGSFYNLNLISATDARDVRVGDFNGDGKIDIQAMYYSSSSSNAFYLIEGNGDGTFKNNVIVPGQAITTSNNSTDILDINSDGYTDIITGYYSGAFQVQTYKAPSFSYIDTTQCGTYTSPSGKHTWDVSGTYNDTLTNVIGGDSIITINLTAMKNTSSSVDLEGDDSVTYMDKTYYFSKTETIILDNAAGCDSTITVNITVNRSPKNDECETVLNFDGVNDYVQLDQTLTIGNSSHTIELWVKIPKINTQNLTPTERVGIILGNYNNSPNTGWEIHNDGQLRIYWNGGQYDKFGTQDLRDDKWHHIAFVRNKSDNTLKGYVDGELDLSFNNAGSDIIFKTTHRIGNDNRGSGNPYFHGAMDEFRIWNVAKTPEELVALSHIKLEGNEANLVNYFDFNEGETSLLIKDRASSTTGTLKSMDSNTDWTKSDGSADPKSFSTQMIEGCDSAMYMGKTYYTTGTDTIIIDNAMGCDSVITLNVMIKESTTSTQMIEGCDSAMFMGKTYYTNDTKTIIIDNAMGCDSVITLNVMIKESTTSTQMIEGCDSVEYLGMTYYKSGTETVILDNAAGCDSIVTLKITINTIVANTITTVGNQFTTNADADSYEWINCFDNSTLDETSNTYFATKAGEYAVIATSGSCVDTSNCELLVVTNTDRSLTNEGLSILPNPTNGEFVINFPNSAGNEVYISILSLQGQNIQSFVASSSISQTVDLSSYAEGTYLVRITANGTTETHRIVKN